jgi:hypothetical protein
VPDPVNVVPPGDAVTVHEPTAGKPLKSTLPVATEHVGCVIVPTTGVVGVDGCVLITAFGVAVEVHPDALVTVNVYVFADKPLNVPVVPDPVNVVPPGDAVTVHEPTAGKPLKSTLPVATEHVGCVIVPTTGVVGVDGCVLITAFGVAAEVHPDAFVTVNVYVFADKPLNVPVVPDPVNVVPPGDAVTVHEPTAGNPLKSTLPVANKHVGCVIVPTIGVVGVDGCASITAFGVAVEVHPDAFVTVNV